MGSQAMIILLLLGLSFAAMVDCNLEGDILFAQKQAWKDPNKFMDNWDPNLVNPCTWFHVDCDANKNVIRVELSNAGISGPLISRLGELEHLQFLIVDRNQINGQIPEELGNLKSIVSLGLYNNLLSGPIPASLGKLNTLKFLRLNDNKLTGKVPNEIQELVRAGSLIVMNVTGNPLDGTA